MSSPLTPPHITSQNVVRLTEWMETPSDRVEWFPHIVFSYNRLPLQRKQIRRWLSQRALPDSKAVPPCPPDMCLDHGLQSPPKQRAYSYAWLPSLGTDGKVLRLTQMKLL